MAKKLLLLGGTAEARALAAAVPSGVHVISSLAGRVSRPNLPEGEVRVGGFGGARGLADYLRTERIDAVVDATHPFAASISANVADAAAETGIPLLSLRRPGWEQSEADDWHWVGSVSEAATLTDRLAERALLTTGRGGLAEFADSRAWLLIRCVDPPEPPLPANHQLLLDRGPYTVDGELTLLRTHRIQLVVTKDSGGSYTAAKLHAAREFGIPVVVIARPEPPKGPLVEHVEDAIDWLSRGIGAE